MLIAAICRSQSNASFMNIWMIIRTYIGVPVDIIVSDNANFMPKNQDHKRTFN